MRIKTVPCLVVNPDGKTSVNLEKGSDSVFCFPKWKCTKVECPIRGRNLPGEVGVAYRPLNVGLGTKYGSEHGIVWCEGAGRSAERKSSL